MTLQHMSGPALPTRPGQTATELFHQATGQIVTLNEATPAGAAAWLYACGLNVFPLPWRSKTPWRGFRLHVFRTTRLPADSLDRAFGDVTDTNVAIMLGRTSGGAFDIDCETHATLAEMIERVKRGGLPLWAYSSRRGGHVLGLCDDAILASIAPGAVADLELRGDGVYSVVPPSEFADPETGELHKYEWIRRDGDAMPTTSLEHWRDVLGLPLRAATKRYGSTTALDGKTAQFLAGFTPEGQRNPQAYTSARELLSRGYSVTSARELIMQGGQKSGLSEREITHVFTNALKGHERDGHEIGNRTTTSAGPAVWQRMTAYAIGHNWTGRTASTDRTVFLAHAQRAQLDAPNATKSATWRATERELAEIARTSRNTVKASTARLCESTEIKRVSCDATGSRYTVGEGVLIDPLYKTASNSGSVNTPSGDAFERTGIGRAAMPVLYTLVDHGLPIMPTALGRLCGLSRDKAKYALKRLARFGLASHGPDGWLATVNALDLQDALDGLAVDLGLYGAGDRRRAKHAKEREYYALECVLKARYGKSDSP